MSRKLVFAGVLYLASVAAAGVLDIRNEEGKGKEPENKKPVANIVKDYVCLRDGELCHPEFGKNRGLYVSCSNGVAWEQQCPKCSYHPLNCPTRTLWFDGEQCDWASPKLASQPCIDRFPVHEVMFNSTNEKDPAMSEQDILLQNLQVAGGSRDQADKNKWPLNSMTGASSPMYFKSPKSGDFEKESSEEEAEVDSNNAKEVKVASENASAEDDEEDDSNVESNKIERKSGEESESEFPTYLNAEDSLIGSKIVRLSDPVYTLVNNPDGSGKQVLMRVSQPFVLEDPARSILPNLNVISSFSDKE